MGAADGSRARMSVQPTPTRAAARAPSGAADPPGADPDMISTGELKKGVAIELDGELWQILDYHHIKMGRGSPPMRITLRNIKRGQTVERSFHAGTKWPRASMEKRPVQFLYRDDDDSPLHGHRHVRPVPPQRPGSARRDRPVPDGRDDPEPDLVPGRDHRRGAAGHGGPGRWSTPSLASQVTPRPGHASRRRHRPGLVVQVPIFVETGGHDPDRHPHRGLPDPRLSGRGTR